MSGRKMSSRIAAGRYSESIDSADVPCVVTIPLKPCERADSSSTRANARSFSTIRTTLSPRWMASRSSSASLIDTGGAGLVLLDLGLLYGRLHLARSAAWRAASIAAVATAAASLDLRAVREGGKATGR
jgi:hypothetical protein